MTTANAIEAMTDAGQFEVLAARVLRQTDPDYAWIEHLGVNADGKTVKNPIDGFCRVPGSKPSRYVMVGFSTDTVDKMERKLLFDHKTSKGKKYKDSDDGDLVKAARSATDIRKQESNAEFIFTFCTNKQPNDELMKMGYAAGMSARIEVRFMARSRIRDHLDTTRDGQWLRKEHLGIAADTLSMPLLHELAAKSANQYSFELFCSGTQIIATATTRRLAAVASQNIPKVSVLIGASGSGKSVACYKLILDVISKGGIALWLPAEVTINSLSLDVTISAVLHALYSTLGPEAGRDAVMLAASHNIPFVLVVDDINRTMNPAQSVRRLVSLHRRMTAGEMEEGAANRVSTAPHLIIPIWNHYWSSIARCYRDEGTVGEITAQAMTPDEARACLRACSNQDLDQASGYEVVRRLEHDPILIGLWGKLYGDKPAAHLDTEASTLIQSYIETSIEEDSGTAKFLGADIRAAVETLAARMLERRELYPRWARVTDWLTTTQVDAVRHICVSGRICRVVQRNGIDRFEFRHDRLLESVLAKPLRACLAEIDANRDIISDPFFTDFVARTIVAIGDPQLVEKILDCAPLAVVRSIRHITEIDTPFAKATATAATRWLIEATTNGTTSSEVVFAASRMLVGTQNPLVLSVTEGVKCYRQFSGARLVNGDAVIGKFFVESQLFFYPNSNASFIEEIVESASRIHRDRLCQELAANLNSGCSTERQLNAALTLAGYIGESSLAEPVLLAWKKDLDNQCLVAALWASIRCSSVPEITLAPMLDSWASLSDEQDAYGMSERNRLLQSLEHCMRHKVNEDVIMLLADRAVHDDRLTLCITAMFKRCDHPLAATIVATRIATIEKESVGADRENPWVLHCRIEWDPMKSGVTRLSDVSRNAILLLWKESKDELVKNSFLQTWISATNSVKELQSLPDEFATSTSVLWRRARLGDLTIADLVLERVEENSYWWQVVPRIWTDRFTDALDRGLGALGKQTPNDFSGGTSDEHFFLSTVLRDIPCEIAEQQLRKHWDSLKYSSRFVQMALYVGGRPLLASADVVIKHAPNDWKPFKFIRMTFGFRTTGLRDRLSDKHINALLPYVNQLDDMDLMEIAAWLMKHGREDDLRKQVSPEISRRIEVQRSEGKKSYIVRLNRTKFPSDADLLAGLSEIENDERMISMWCHSATERGDSPERIRTVLRKWFSDEPSPQRLRIVAKIVLKLGQREDVADLQKYQAEYGDDSTKIFVDGATFSVRYRTLS